jgi:hypothetical protein
MEALLDFIVPLIQGLSAKYPVLVSVFLVMGVLRSIFKPLMTFLHAYVLATPSEKDNKKLAKLESSKVYKAIVFLVDYFSSVKLKK